MNSAKPVCGVTTGAGGCREINAENSQTDRHADRKAAARSPHVRSVLRGRRREMRRSGAAALHGLNEAQQDCRARRRSPTCMQAHTLPRTGRQAGTHAARTEISLSRFNLIFHRLNRSPRSVLQTHINTTRTRKRTFHPLLHPLQSLLDHPASVFHLLWRFVHL